MTTTFPLLGLFRKITKRDRKLKQNKEGLVLRRLVVMLERKASFSESKIEMMTQTVKSDLEKILGAREKKAEKQKRSLNKMRAGVLCALTFCGYFPNFAPHPLLLYFSPGLP